jgi:glycosyltransferase involved in cell wall biosynthesis
MSCGKPVVAFDTGGISDLIEHKVNGYLANYGDVKDLADGIAYFNDKQNRQLAGAKARKHVLDTCSKEIVSKRYINLYSEILSIN